MARRRRTYNVRLLKATWPYKIEEIADLFGIHKNAVTRWAREGLTVNRSRRPYLIRGDDLALFLAQRQARRKRPCAFSEFYCFKCRQPRPAYLNIADITVENRVRFRLSSLCAECGSRLGKIQGIGKLSRALQAFEVQKLEGRGLIDCDECGLSGDKELPR